MKIKQHCNNCNKMLFVYAKTEKQSGKIEIKCTRCKEINKVTI